MSCILCDEPAPSMFCAKCGRAYDRASRTLSGDHAAVYAWVAARVRKHEQAKSARLRGPFVEVANAANALLRELDAVADEKGRARRRKKSDRLATALAWVLSP